MNLKKSKGMLAATCILLALSTSCKKSAVDVEPPIKKVDPPVIAGKKGIQAVETVQFGTILTDSAGKSLYFFANDVAGTSNCTGACELVWTPYYSANLSTDISVKTAEVGTITRIADGKKQSTYKGYPLYFYKDDLAASEVKGDGINGLWFVAKPDYSLMIANAQLTGLNAKQYTSLYVEGAGKTVYITDDHGRTLYALSTDKNNKNVFTTNATTNAAWPIYESEIKNVPSIITKNIVAVIDVNTIGKKQLTYRGWPLYYFGQDATRGDNRGVSVGAFPGFWKAMSNDLQFAPN